MSPATRVTCPTCGATPHEPCRTHTGCPAAVHVARTRAYVNRPDDRPSIEMWGAELEPRRAAVLARFADAWAAGRLDDAIDLAKVYTDDPRTRRGRR